MQSAVYRTTGPRPHVRFHFAAICCGGGRLVKELSRGALCPQADRIIPSVGRKQGTLRPAPNCFGRPRTRVRRARQARGRSSQVVSRGVTGVELVGVGVLRRWFASFSVLVAELGCLCEVVSPAGHGWPRRNAGPRTGADRSDRRLGFQAAVRLGTSWSAWGGSGSVRKPRYQRARDPDIFLPVAVEQIRGKLENLRDRTLVSVLAYSGPRPEEVVCRLSWDDVGNRAIRYRDTKRRRVRFTPLLSPLAEDLREWILASGPPDQAAPVFPAHDRGFWDRDDWRNWRRLVWTGAPARPANDRRRAKPATPGCAPSGSRPRDLRSSFITLRVYEGVPLTQIACEVGTSIAMIEQHYAGVIENWDGTRVPAELQIRAARSASGRGTDAATERRRGNE